MGAGRPEALAMAIPAMASAREADDAHAGGDGPFHARHQILDHDAALRPLPHLVRRMQKDIGRGLAIGDESGREARVFGEEIVELRYGERCKNPLRQGG